jgi:polysaccharide biosynthesis transport protein
MSRYFDLMQQAGIGEAAIAGNRAGHVSAHVKSSAEDLDAEDLDADQGQSGPSNSEVLDLVQRIFLIPAEDAPRMVVFAGVDGQRDVSQLSVSVAATLAGVSKRRVCLVEANFRTPKLHGKLGAVNRRGLTDALSREEAVSSFCQPMAQENLWLLPSGSLDAGSPSLITPENLKNRLTELRDSFEFIIVDGAPVGPYAETIILSRMADGLALVLETGSTRREEAAAAIANLRALNIPIVAAVLNKTGAPRFRKFFR